MLEPRRMVRAWAIALLARLRSPAGQASVEYVGIVVVAAALIAAIIGSGIADDIRRALENAIQDIVGENGSS
jgi:uncharacterized membrane protein